MVTTQYDVSTVKVPADVKTKISAAKEILKRYPDNDKLLEQQIRKLTAEADISEYKAKVMTDATNLEDKTVIVSDLPDE